MKFDKKDIPMLVIAFCTLVFPFILRERLLGRFALINAPVWLALFYTYRERMLTLPEQKWKNGLILSYFTVALLLLFLIPGNGWSIKRKILLILIYLLPSVFLFSNLSDESCIDRYQKIWLSSLRIVCGAMLLCWVIDFLAGEPWLQTILVDFYGQENLEVMLQQYRFVSFLGHPLASASIFLSLAVWGTIHKQIHSGHTLLYLMDVGFSVCGILVCGSKAALLLVIGLIFLSNLSFKRMNFLLIFLGLLVVFWMAGFFDLVIARILDGIAKGDLSTGRITHLKTLLESGEVSFNLLRGHEYDYYSWEMTAALELPFLGWSFTCGIVFAVLQYLMYFVYPGLKVLFSKNFTLLLCMLVLMAFANAHNGIYSFNDDLLVYSLNIWLMLQIAAKQRREKHT